jgi:hypothetical protein
LEREQRSQYERRDDARMRHGNRRVRAASKQTAVQLQPDEKHVQHDAELRDHAQKRSEVGRKNPGRKLRREAPEERRAQDDPSKDFAENGRLSDRSKQPAEKPSGDDDGGQRRQDMEDRVRSDRYYCAGRRRSGAWRCGHRFT